MRQDGVAGPCVNAAETISLAALVAYLSTASGQSEFRIERQLADRFNIPNAKYLPASRYDEAIRYLVDQIPEGVVG